VVPQALVSSANADILKNQDIAKQFQEDKFSVDVVGTGKAPNAALIEGVGTDIAHKLYRNGPVIALNTDGSANSSADVENLNPPFVLGNNRYFYFISADAMTATIEVIDLNHCTVIWKSPSYDLDKDIQYKNGQFIVANKIKYKIQPNCQIK